jgi:hypothetical protein
MKRLINYMIVFGGKEPYPSSFVPNAFLRGFPDNSVTVIFKHSKGGQGTFTGSMPHLAKNGTVVGPWEEPRAIPAR